MKKNGKNLDIKQTIGYWHGYILVPQISTDGYWDIFYGNVQERIDASDYIDLPSTDPNFTEKMIIYEHAKPSFRISLPYSVQMCMDITKNETCFILTKKDSSE